MENTEAQNRKIGLIIGGGIGLSIILFMVISISRISYLSTAMYIYNPHQDILDIEIDGKNYELSSKELTTISLDFGSHKATAHLGNTLIHDTTFNISSSFKKNGGMINLSGEPLYLWTERYGTELPVIQGLFNDSSSVNETQNSRFKVLRIDTSLVVGDIKEYSKNEIAITKEWFYGIDSDFPEEIELTSSDFLNKDVAKLFDKESALKYWKEKLIIYKAIDAYNR